MEKNDLLLNANVGKDVERLRRIVEYDQSVGGMKLYRYRPLDEKRLYELDALESCQIWASNPNLFDDEFELCTSNSSKDDYKFIEFFVKRNAIKQHHYPYQDLANLRKMSRATLSKRVAMEFKNNRERYVVSCFTENSPIDGKVMWQQYAYNQGFCLEYSLMSFVNAHIIIDPVYYIENKSLGDVFKLFNESEKSMLLMCIKNKYGVDKYSSTGEIISWEQQREWRYVLYNEKDTNGKYKSGLYSTKVIKPDKVYVKGLNQDWIHKVEKAAEVNQIPVIEIGAGTVRKLGVRTESWT